MEYKCKWCSEIKPEEQFVRRNTKEPYSERNIRCCKACNQARNRQRYKDPEIRRKQLEANKKWSKENPEKMGVYQKSFLEKRPNNLKARSKVGYMVRRGYWTAQPCEVCGTTESVEAHHDSYAEAHWTTVRWLCKAHHEQWHQSLDPVKSAILEEPLAKVAMLRAEHDSIQIEMSGLRRKALAIKKEAEDLEFYSWSAVQLAASEMYPSVFKK